MDESTERQILNVLSELAGIDTHDVNLRDHSKAWEVMEALIAAQRKPLAEAKAVMSLIGPLLDAWEGLDSDVLDVFEKDASELNESLTAVRRAMEDAE